RDGSRGLPAVLGGQVRGRLRVGRHVVVRHGNHDVAARAVGMQAGQASADVDVLLALGTPKGQRHRPALLPKPSGQSLSGHSRCWPILDQVMELDYKETRLSALLTGFLKDTNRSDVSPQ